MTMTPNAVHRVISAAMVVAAASKGRMRNHAIEELREALDQAGIDWKRIQHLVRAVEERRQNEQTPPTAGEERPITTEERPITTQEMTSALATMIAAGRQIGAAAVAIEGEGGAWG
jgi:hypothetical protein